MSKDGEVVQEAARSLVAVGFGQRQDEPQQGCHREESNVPKDFEGELPSLMLSP